MFTIFLVNVFTTFVYVALVTLIWEVLSRRFLLEKIFSLILVFAYLSFALMLAGLELLSLVILLLYVGAIAVLFLFVVMILNPDYHLLLEEQKDIQAAAEAAEQLELQKKNMSLYDRIYDHLFAGFLRDTLIWFFTVIFWMTILMSKYGFTFLRTKSTNIPPVLPDGNFDFKAVEPYVYVYDGSESSLIQKVFIEGFISPLYFYKKDLQLVELGQILYTNYGIGVFVIGGALLVAMIGSILLCVRQTLKLKRQNISKQSKRYK